LSPKGVDFEDLRNMDGAASATTFSSPAMPSVFDVSGSASSSMTNVGTVSPQDLLIHEPYMSAPNSTALTALTSPSIYNESPDFNDAFNMSPNLDGGEFDSGSGDPWFPLFPSEVPLGATGTDQSPDQGISNPEPTESTTRQKKRKSGGASPGTPSSGSGVGSRRREKTLPPIIVEDPNDVVAMKRARNTLAARKSRERKAHRLDELEDRIATLERERDYWKRLAEERDAA
jgi:general control protein GCN4